MFYTRITIIGSGVFERIKKATPKQATLVALRGKRLEEKRGSLRPKKSVSKVRRLNDSPGPTIQLGIRQFLRAKSGEGETEAGNGNSPRGNITKIKVGD